MASDWINAPKYKRVIREEYLINKYELGVFIGKKLIPEQFVLDTVPNYDENNKPWWFEYPQRKKHRRRYK